MSLQEESAGIISDPKTESNKSHESAQTFMTFVTPKINSTKLIVLLEDSINLVGLFLYAFCLPLTLEAVVSKIKKRSEVTRKYMKQWDRERTLQKGL